MAIDKISGTAWTAISNIQGVAKSGIANILGQTPPSTGGGTATVSNVTYIEPSATFDSGWTINHQSPTAGQLILLIGTGGKDVYDSTDTVTNMTATGFTNILDQGPNNTVDGFLGGGTINVFTRIATGSEGTSSIAMDQDKSNYTIFWYITIDNANTTTPVNVIGSMSTFSSSPPSVVADAITTTTAGSIAFAVFATRGNAFNPFTVSGTGWPTSPTDDDDMPNSFNSVFDGTSGGFAYKAMPTAGTTNDLTVTANSAGGGVIHAVQFAVQP